MRKAGDGFIRPKTLLSLIDKAASDKKAEDIVALDMRRVSNLCDYFFICSAGNIKQAKAIADAIIETLEKRQVRCWHKEGYGDALWIALDYNDVIVHIFCAEVRAFYKIERLWGDAPRVAAAPKKRTKCKKTSSKKKLPA